LALDTLGAVSSSTPLRAVGLSNGEVEPWVPLVGRQDKKTVDKDPRSRYDFILSGGGLIPIRVEVSVLGRWLQLSGTTLLVASLYLAAAGLRAATGSVKMAPPTPAKSSVKNTSHETKNGAPKGKAKSAGWRRGHSAWKLRAAKPNQNSHTSDEVRRSAIRPEPQRVQEIQRALIQAGELHEEPTGQWDEATREAMKCYQIGHGFTVTGLPDSKSLMQMGLGPHPLPPEVATPASTRASLGPAVTSASPPALGRDDPSANPDPPQQHR